MPKKLRFRKLDGKFSHDGTCVVNTVSGEAIPADEPIFILRGRDRNAISTLIAYIAQCKDDGCNELHLQGIEQSLAKFRVYARSSSAVMKQPGMTGHLRLEPEFGPSKAAECIPALQALDIIAEGHRKLDCTARLTASQPGGISAVCSKKEGHEGPHNDADLEVSWVNESFIIDPEVHKLLSTRDHKQATNCLSWVMRDTVRGQAELARMSSVNIAHEVLSKVPSLREPPND